MPEDGRQRETLTRVEARFERYAGPIPSSKEMRGHEDVLPGSADRILSMAEREQKFQIAYAMCGLFFGFIAALLLIALSAYVVSLGFAWQSVGVVIGSIAGTAGTFIYSNRARRQELDARRQVPPARPKLPESSGESG